MFNCVVDTTYDLYPSVSISISTQGILGNVARLPYEAMHEYRYQTMGS